MYRRFPKLIAILTGTFALAAVSGIGLTITTDTSAAAACTSTITGSHSRHHDPQRPGHDLPQERHARRRHHGNERPRTLRGGLENLRSHHLDVQRPLHLLPQLNGSGRHQGLEQHELRLDRRQWAVLPGQRHRRRGHPGQQQGGVQLGRNSIAGAVTANKNIAGTAIVISNNHVDGKLTCSDNTPAPVNNGQGNTVSGERVGQTVRCRHLLDAKHLAAHAHFILGDVVRRARRLHTQSNDQGEVDHD